MDHPLILIAALAALAVLYVVVPVAAEGLARFRKGIHVDCPETGQSVDVSVTPSSAAAWSFRGPGSLRVVRCPLWPERQGCDRGCVARA